MPSVLPFTKTVSGVSSTGTASFTNGVYEFRIGHGEEIEFSEILKDLLYEIEELDVADYTVICSNPQGDMTEDRTVEFVNRRNAVVPTGVKPDGKSLALLFLSLAGLTLFFLYEKKKQNSVQEG